MENSNKLVWILIEAEEGEITDASLEMLSEAREYAEKNRLEVTVFVEGGISRGAAESLKRYGFEVCCLDQDRFPGVFYVPEAVSQYLSSRFSALPPALVLAPETSYCREVVVRVASAVDQPVVPDCISFPTIEYDSIRCVKLHHQEKLESRFSIKPGYVPFVTIRAGMFNIRDFKKDNGSLAASVVNISRYVKPKAVQYVKGNPLKMDLADAEVIVAGGRGMGSKENFQVLWELAGLIGAAVGGSRVARDEGWIAPERQIGQTGKFIAPKLLISCGISGASQHVLGMREAKAVIAINRDKNAPIHKLADVKIVGDVMEIIPKLVDILTRYLDKRRARIIS